MERGSPGWSGHGRRAPRAVRCATRRVIWVVACCGWPNGSGRSAQGIDALSSNAPPRPLVLGVIAAEAGIAAEELVRLAVYDDLASAVGALLKLDPRDPADGVSLVLESCASVEPFVAATAAIWSPNDIPALSAPQAEAWAEQHATTQRRLFRG